MEITTRSLLTLIHGMGFGALYPMACSGALVELHRRYGSPMKPVEWRMNASSAATLSPWR